MPGEVAWTSTAIDLELDKELISWRVPQVGGVVSHVSAADASYSFAALRASHSTVHACDGEGGYVMARGSFVLGWTVEKIHLPFRSRIAARVEGKSSLARLGVGVHVTAPTVHAGFEFNPSGEHGAPLQLEIWNAGPLHVKLSYKMRICQVIFELVDPRKRLRRQLLDSGAGQAVALPWTKLPFAPRQRRIGWHVPPTAPHGCSAMPPPPVPPAEQKPSFWRAAGEWCGKNPQAAKVIAGCAGLLMLALAIWLYRFEAMWVKVAGGFLLLLQAPGWWFADCLKSEKSDVAPPPPVPPSDPALDPIRTRDRRVLISFLSIFSAAALALLVWLAWPTGWTKEQLKSRFLGASGESVYRTFGKPDPSGPSNTVLLEGPAYINRIPKPDGKKGDSSLKLHQNRPLPWPLVPRLCLGTR